jgi:hypothetical protein
MKTALLLIALMFASPVEASIRGFNSSNVDLGHFSEVKCSTGMTCTKSAGKFNMVSSPTLVGPLTLESGEIINNTVDDTVEIISNDEVTTLQVAGFEAKAAILNLWADQGDDASDKYSLTADTSNNLIIKNSTTALLTFSSSGVQTLPNLETVSNATDDTIAFASEDEHTTVQITGFEAKNAILNLYADQGDDDADKFSIKSDTSNELSIINNATVIHKYSSSGVQTLADSETITDASDVVSLGFDDAAASFKLVGFEASNSGLTLVADESDDSGDDWQLLSVASGNTFTISNDASGSQVAKVTIAASDGDLTLTGGITGDGGDSLSGFLESQVASTTTGITAAQCGSTFVSNSADVMTLPEASTVLGCRLTFVCGTADDLDVNPADGTDVIGVINSVASGTGAAITPSAGDAIRCTDLGSSIVLEAVAADLWVAIGVGNGAWTDIN